MGYKDEILNVLLYEKNENFNGLSTNQLRKEELNGIVSLLSDKNGNFIENYLQYVLVSMS